MPTRMRVSAAFAPGLRVGQRQRRPLVVAPSSRSRGSAGCFGSKSRSIGQPRSIQRTSVRRSSSVSGAHLDLLAVRGRRTCRRRLPAAAWRCRCSRGRRACGSPACRRPACPSSCSVCGVARHRLGREVVVAPAVGAPAVDLPDQQAAPRLEHADVARRLAAPRADQRLVAVLGLAIHRQPVVRAGHGGRAAIGDAAARRSRRRRGPGCRPASPTSACGRRRSSARGSA